MRARGASEEGVIWIAIAATMVAATTMATVKQDKWHNFHTYILQHEQSKKKQKQIK